MNPSFTPLKICTTTFWVCAKDNLLKGIENSSGAWLKSLVFRSSHFLFLVTFGDEVMKILCILCLHFARQDGKKMKKNHTIKVTKIPKTKRQKNWMNETKVTLILTL